jgi:hypothetical protein
VLPPVDCLWGWIVPLLLDDRVNIVFRVKTISRVIKVYIIKTLGFCIHILDVCMTI